VDGYDPSHRGTRELLGFRSDPSPGLADRILQFEYDDRLGRPLRFRLLSPARLREAAAPTPWVVDEVRRSEGGDDGAGHHYLAALRKSSSVASSGTAGPTRDR
jgi:hypothetical protein